MQEASIASSIASWRGIDFASLLVRPISSETYSDLIAQLTFWGIVPVCSKKAPTAADEVESLQPLGGCAACGLLREISLQLPDLY